MHPSLDNIATHEAFSLVDLVKPSSVQGSVKETLAYQILLLQFQIGSLLQNFGCFFLECILHLPEPSFHDFVPLFV
jgi:hypothetical protein